MTVITGFGRDTSCLTELRPGRYAAGARLVAEAAYRRLTTPKGALLGGDDEANYGLDLLEVIGAMNPKAIAAALPAQIRHELLQDDRISSVDVVCNVVTSGPNTTIQIEISAETDVGPFDLTLAVSDVSVDVVGLEV